MVKCSIDRANMSLFKEVVSRAKDIDESLLIDFGEDTVTFGAVSSGKSTAVVIKIHNSFFEQYECNTPTKAYINAKILSRTLSRFSDVKMVFENELRLFSDDKTGMKIPVFAEEEQFNYDGIFDMTLENVLVLPNSLLGEAVKDMGIDNISSSLDVSLSLADYILSISRTTDYIQTSKDLAVDSEGSASIVIDYDNFAKIVTSLASKANEVRLDIQNEKPAIIRYLFPEGIQIVFAIAPKAREYEEDIDDNPEDEQVDNIEWDDEV